MLKRAYIEITNICNLRCEFCPGTKRDKREMSEPEFRTIAEKLRGTVKYLYFHVMGEPLLHGEITKFLDIAKELGFRVCLTTNGTLLGRRGRELLSHSALHKVSVSLHSMEGNGISDLQSYLEDVWEFSVNAAESGVIVALRLWNIGGADERNGDILAFLEEKLGIPPLTMPQPRDGNWKLREKIYLEQAERFEWPDLAAGEAEVRFCLGLRQQIATLLSGKDETRSLHSGGLGASAARLALTRVVPVCLLKFSRFKYRAVDQPGKPLSFRRSFPCRYTHRPLQRHGKGTYRYLRA